MSAGSFDWFDQAERNQDTAWALATTPGAVALVESAVRRKGGRTPLVRVMCGDHPSGAAFSLGVSDGAVNLEWAAGSPLLPRPVLVDTRDGAPHVLACAVCGRETARNSVWILREALYCLDVWTRNRATRLNVKWTA